MPAEHLFTNHHQPEKQWRFIGVGHSLMAESEESAVSQRLVNNAQIPQLVAWRVIAKKHDGQQGN